MKVLIFIDAAIDEKIDNEIFLICSSLQYHFYKTM